ncbi:hypothetical protein JCM8097_004065 [Rhodosporidiobolus ruineniae]
MPRPGGITRFKSPTIGGDLSSEPAGL